MNNNNKANKQTRHQFCGYGKSNSQYGPEIIYIRLTSFSNTDSQITSSNTLLPEPTPGQILGNDTQILENDTNIGDLSNALLEEKTYGQVTYPNQISSSNNVGTFEFPPPISSKIKVCARNGDCGSLGCDSNIFSSIR